MSPSIIEGAEPLSVTGEASGGVLVLHGFTGNPQSMRPIAQVCVEKGYSVEMPLLPGHGTDISEMLQTNYSDYIACADRTLQELKGRCESVVVIGLSMGGTLSLDLALSHPDIAGMILVNPLCEAPAESFIDILESTLESGIETFQGIGSDIAMEGSTELSYPETPLRPLLSLFVAVGNISTKLDQITIPVLLFSSVQDHVVPPSNGDLLEKTVAGPIDRVMLERSYHVATLDYDAQVILDGTVEFLDRILS